MIKNLKDRLYVCTFAENYIEAIRDFQVGMEINHTCISDCLDDDEKSRKKLLGDIERDIKLSNPTDIILHGPFTEIIPAGIDYKSREFGLWRLNQAYDVATHFSVKKMVVHNGWIPFMYFKDWQAEKGAIFWNQLMENKPDDFTIVVENVLEDEPMMIKKMMDQIEDPRIRICLDIGHAHSATLPEYRVEDWIEILSPYISHFHIHNNDGTKDTHSPLDQGTMNIHSILSAIDGFCEETSTLTIEAMKCIPCLNWLRNHNYI